jgi:hypothetical protein
MATAITDQTATISNDVISRRYIMGRILLRTRRKMNSYNKKTLWLLKPRAFVFEEKQTFWCRRPDRKKDSSESCPGEGSDRL